MATELTPLQVKVLEGLRTVAKNPIDGWATVCLLSAQASDAPLATMPGRTFASTLAGLQRKGFYTRNDGWTGSVKI